MPKAKNPITAEERSRRFDQEVRKRSEAGDFDQDAAEAALERLIRLAPKRVSPPEQDGETDSEE